MTRATTYQRSYIHNLLQRNEFDVWRVNPRILLLCRQARTRDPIGDMLVDDWINGLSHEEASAIIRVLKDDYDV